MKDKTYDGPTVFQAILISMVAICSYILTSWLLADLPSEADIAADQHWTYCEMVRLHKADPTVGWPDYKHIYDKECNE